MARFNSTFLVVLSSAVPVAAGSELATRQKSADQSGFSPNHPFHHRNDLLDRALRLSYMIAAASDDSLEIIEERFASHLKTIREFETESLFFVSDEQVSALRRIVDAKGHGYHHFSTAGARGNTDAEGKLHSNASRELTGLTPSPTVPLNTTCFVRFNVIEVRAGSGGSVQLSEFALFDQYGDEIDLSAAAITNFEGDNTSGQGPGEAIDGDLNTKWLDENGGNLVIGFNLDSALDVASYDWASANDTPERDPIRFSLDQRFNVNSVWVMLDDTFETSGFATTMDRFTWQGRFQCSSRPTMAPTLSPTSSPFPSASPAPTPNPTASMFEIESGKCTAVGACFYSPGFPNVYSRHQSCDIAALDDGVLIVESFEVEYHATCAYDDLTIDGVQFCGTTGPDGVSVTSESNITFSSDGYVVGGGFEICLFDYPSPAPTLTPVPSLTPVPTSSPTSYATLPITCAFEGIGWCGWTSDVDYAWTRGQGSTPSSSTGPTADHTTGAGFYAFVEASGQPNTGPFTLESPELSGGSAGALIEFYYCMYGAYMGTLRLDTFDGATWITRWVLSGNQGTGWQSASIDLVGMEVVRVRFVGSTGAIDYTSDMAIDDVSIESSTAVPTPSPTALPSPLPTPSPTSTTKFSIAPESLSLSATKPENAAGNAYLINLNNQPLNGTIWMVRSTHLPSSACSITPATFTVDPGQLVTIVITFNTAGLAPNEYDLAFGVVAQTPNSLPVNQTYTAKLSIKAKAVASTTKVSISGLPTIGKDWDGIDIYPYDSDGLAISNDKGEDFSVSLRSPTGVLSSCAVTWADLYYQGKCNVPVVSEASEWNLTISLDDHAFSSSSVRMMCEDGYYDNPTTEACDVCPRGTICPIGTTLASMQMESGYFRISETTGQVRACPLSAGCKGGNVTSRYCSEGHEGPLCARCAGGYYMLRNKCSSCASASHWGFVRAVATFVSVVIGVRLISRSRRFRAVYQFVVRTLGIQMRILLSATQILAQYPTLFIEAMPTALADFFCSL